MEMSVEKLQALLTVAQVAELHDVPARVVRKAAKADPPTIPGVIEVLGKYGFDPDLVTSWTPPEAGVRAVGASREDGRQRYHIFATKEEAAKLLSDGYELVDPREASKARRAAKKAAAAAGENQPEDEPGASDDVFADFGA